MPVVIELSGVAKNFIMHLQGGVRLSVVADVAFAVKAGECVVLDGPSGVGKSSVLKMIFGSYRCDRGQILVHRGAQHIDVADAAPRRILGLRRDAIAYVSQFLRAVPRVPANGAVRDAARTRAGELLRRLNIPAPLWELPPATFSGGEQQRVNVARGLLPERPILLLDEPTASLDAANCAVVMDLIAEKKRRGTAIVAVVHDPNVRNRIADRVIDLTKFRAAA